MPQRKRPESLDNKMTLGEAQAEWRALCKVINSIEASGVKAPERLWKRKRELTAIMNLNYAEVVEERAVEEEEIINEQN